MSGSLKGLEALTNMKILNIRQTQLTGELRDLSNLTNLVSLYLDKEGITGRLSDLSGLQHLDTLVMYSIEGSGDIGKLDLFANLDHGFPSLSYLSLTITLPPITFNGAPVAVKALTKDGVTMIPKNLYDGTFDPDTEEILWAIPRTSSGTLNYNFQETIKVGDKDNVTFSCTAKQPYTVKPQPSPSPSPSGSIITASAGEHGSISPEGTVWAAYGSDKTFQFVPEDGYKVKDVVIDGESAGAISSYTFKTITKPHTIDVTFEPEETPEETPEDRLIAGVEATTIKASSQAKKGKMIIRWKKSWGYKVDCFQIFRSTKKNSGFGKKPFFTTKSGTKNMYTNTKQLKKGTRYYYKIRGVRVIDGQTIYTKWSNKAYRIAR